MRYYVQYDVMVKILILGLKRCVGSRAIISKPKIKGRLLIYRSSLKVSIIVTSELFGELFLAHCIMAN